MCAVAGDSVSFQAVGTCTIDANQAGSETYAEATEAQLSFPVGAGVLGITSAPATTFTAGQAGTFTVTTSPGSAGNSPGTIALTETGALPTGVSFTDNGNGTATLAGMPAAGTGGVYSFTVDASNGIDPDVSEGFTLDVDQAPAITSAGTSTFTTGQADTFSVTSSGFPAAALSESGALPTGVTFIDNGNGTATLAGTPAAGTGGVYSLTVDASNGIGAAATQTFTLDVDAPPGITSAGTTTFAVGQAGTFSVTTTAGTRGGLPGSVALSETGTLPAGVTFTDNGDGTATLAGAPTAGTAGTYGVSVTATNGVAPGAIQSFTLEVQDVPGAPQYVTASSGVDSAIVSWAPPATDGLSSISGYTVTADPGGGTVSAGATATETTFSGLTPGVDYTFTVSATNSVGTGPASPASNTVEGVSVAEQDVTRGPVRPRRGPPPRRRSTWASRRRYPGRPRVSARSTSAVTPATPCALYPAPRSSSTSPWLRGRRSAR